jgi:putative ABC transport system permease protein
MHLADLRYASRLGRRTPFLSAVVVVVLAGGIALATCVFGLVNAVWLRPLPYPEPSRLVVVSQSHPRLGFASLIAPAAYDAVKATAGWCESAGAFAERSFTLGRPGTRAERVRGISVDPELLALLGARTVAGRSLSAEDAASGASAVALVSERFWRRVAGGDPGFVGTTFKLDGVQTTAVGVLPYGFRVVNSGFDVFIPRRRAQAEGDGRSLFVIARLASGVTLGAAAARLQALSDASEQAAAPDERGWSPLLRPLDAVMWGEARPAFLLLLTAALLLLALVAANVANLLIARSEARRREFAVRLAIGAGRAGIVRQLLAEALVPAALSAALALLLCLWLQSILVALVPEVTDLRLDARVFAFTACVSLMVGLALGYLPALSVLRHDLVGGLNRDAAGNPGLSRKGGPLAIAQFAVAAALLTCCGLLVRGVFAIRSADPGFDTARLLTASVALPAASYPTPEARQSLCARVAARLTAIPGVVSVALTTALPLDGGVGRLRVEAAGRPSPDEAMQASSKAVSPKYFTTLGTRLVAGRGLRGEDTQVAVVNGSMARALWKSETAAVGARVRIDGGPWRTVVGVVGDVRQVLTAPAAPEVYLPFEGAMPAPVSLVVRTAGEPAAVTSGLAAALQQVDPDLVVFDIWSMDTIVDSYIPRPIVGAFLLLSAIALLLGALGLYAVIAFQVTRRTREFGIRIALGADERRVRRLVLGEGLRLTGFGMLIGAGAGLGLGRLLASRFADVGVLDPPLVAAVALLLAVVSLAACLIPARSAMRVAPAEALRRE